MKANQIYARIHKQADANAFGFPSEAHFEPLNFALHCLIGVVCFNAVLISLAGPSAMAADGPKLQRALPVGCQIGRESEITLTGTFPTWPVQVWSPTDEINFRPLEASGKLAVSVKPETIAGVRYFRLFDANGATSVFPIVVDNCNELIEVEPNDHHRNAQAVPMLPISISGCLEKSGDVDTFQVSLKQGQTLVASVAAQSLGAPMDADLQLLNGDGIVLMQQLDYRGLDPELRFTAPKDGNYLLRIFAFPETPNSTIAYAGGDRFVYRLLVTTGAFVEFSVPAGLTRLHENKLEFVGVNLEGRPSSIQVPGLATEVTRQIALPGSHGSLSLPVTSGEQFVDTEPNYEKVAISKSAQPVTVPTIITGQITQAGDMDAFRFQSSKGNQWKISIDSRELGFPLDAVLTIFNSENKQLATSDDVGENRDPSLSFVTPTDGEFTVVVSDMYREGTSKHWYRLIIEPEVADFTLTTNADIFTGKVNEPIEVNVTVQRTLDFPGEIAIGLETDIAGSTFQVNSKKGDDSAKSVKLSIQTSQPFSGPIRIIGKSESVPPRFARPAKHPIDWLWLTVTP